jgi:hypothetical protein
MNLDELTDEQLAGQPAAYWTGVAYEALIAFTRRKQAEAGFTQPGFWLLRNLSVNDLSPDGRGRTVAELEEVMSTYLRARTTWRPRPRPSPGRDCSPATVTAAGRSPRRGRRRGSR